IFVTMVADQGSFTGNVVNTAAISALHTGIVLSDVGIAGFSGNISNRGAIASTQGSGIAIATVAAGTGAAFTGTIVNSAAIAAARAGIAADNVGAAAFSGGISNPGAITATGQPPFPFPVFGTGQGIRVDDVASAGTFSGTIFNKGAITAGGTGI